ncbi:MAG: efflux RND transporter permease subunit, partial [Methylococcales bacterium]|nr:efflux RND transporter permease subunit [Methylococcales bacterium]
MKSIIEFSLKRVVFFNVVFILLMVTGVYSLMTNPVENMPPVDMGEVYITTVYYGASADDIENLISRKIEKALNGIENIEYVRSTSSRNYSTVQVKFIDDTDYRKLYDEIRFKIQNIRSELPKDADESIYTYIDTQVWMPVIIVNIAGDLPNRSLKLLADELKTRLKSIAFVKDIGISGHYKNEFHVSLDHQKLRKHGITFQQAVNAVKSANTKIPTGRLQSGNIEYMLDAGSRLSSQESVLDVVVRRDGDGNFIRIRDVVSSAKVSHRMPEIMASVNGNNTIQLRVLKETEGNSISIAERVQQISADFVVDHQQDAISIAYTHDSTIEIHDSINTLGGNLALGICLVVIVLWITLGFSNAMITAVGIPFSFLVCLILVKYTGQSINTISLFSFVLVSGIIVDDAIIALENIHRHLEMGKKINEAIIDGVSEIMLPIITSSVTTILAFIPMLIMTGTTGDFFSVIPKAVTYALLASLFEALFILPIHVKDWTSKKTLQNIGQHQTINDDPYQHLKTGVFAKLWNAYFKILDILLAHQIKTLLSVFALFFFSLT